MVRSTNLVLILCVLLLWACENDMEDVEALEQRLNISVETVNDVEILYSDSAQVKIRIQGATMLNHLNRQDPKQEFVDGVHVDFFEDRRTINSTLVANYAVRFERQGKIICRDSVVWASRDGQKLETEELIWDEQDKEIYTQKFARITTPGRIIYGHGFRANQDFSNARILHVDGIIPVEDVQEGL